MTRLLRIILPKIIYFLIKYNIYIIYIFYFLLVLFFIPFRNLYEVFTQKQMVLISLRTISRIKAFERRYFCIYTHLYKITIKYYSKTYLMVSTGIKPASYYCMCVWRLSQLSYTGNSYIIFPENTPYVSS